MKRIGSLWFLSFIFSVVFPQQGSPLLTHFTESRKVEDQSWGICQDDNNVMLFAYRKGILTFDGQEWKSISVPHFPYTMQKNPADGKIYIGGENNFGYLAKDNSGGYRYVSLSGDSCNCGIITKIVFCDSLAWFYSERSIFRINLKTNSAELRIDSRPGSLYSGMFITPEHTFINVSGIGLHRLESDTLFPIVTGYLTENLEILFSLPYDDSRVIVGLGNGEISLFDGIKYYDYPIKDEGYLKENILSDGIILGDTAYAFSTLDGGALVIRKDNGKLLFTINNQHELPDDEIFAIGSDRSGGLWLSHQYGLTRADLTLPFGNFTIFPGLRGNLTSVIRHNGELFVATSDGIFYLDEVRNFAEVEILVRSKPGTETSSQPLIPESSGEEQTGRKKIFTRIFGRRSTVQKEIKGADQASPVISQQVTRRKVSKLKSINYIFRKVEGLNDKCRQLVSTPNGILAATNRGLYVINDRKASQLVSERYINFISWEPVGDKYAIGANDGYLCVSCKNGKWITEIPDPDFYNPVYSACLQENILWLGGENVVYRTDLETDADGKIYKVLSVKNEFPQRYVVDLIHDTIFLHTESGLYFFNGLKSIFEPYLINSFAANDSEFEIPLSNKPLIKIKDDWYSFDNEARTSYSEWSYLKIFDEVVAVAVEPDTLWVIDGTNKLYAIDRKRSSSMQQSIDILIKNISNSRGISFDLSEVRFNRGDDLVIFDIVAPGYLKQNTTRYQYKISKLMEDWSAWSVDTHYEKPVTRHGDYELFVRAQDLWGNTGESLPVKFTIRAPFTRTAVFYCMVGFVLLVGVILVVRFRERQLHEKNRVLEEKVRERTAEIEAQKEEITASIEYASRIQMAMLPVRSHFKDVFSDHFVLFKPRDIVSGDFYWIAEDKGSVFFTVSDCTGHGVPGAFMSTLGISTLNEIVANSPDLQANTALNLLRAKTKMSLHQTGQEGEAADGMDIAFCVLRKNRKTLEYSGAFNSLVLFHKGEIQEYKGDRMPIGIHYGDEQSFTNNVIPISKGDTVYIFSDGFADQFGGPDGTKYKKSNLKRLLADIQGKSMAEQHDLLEEELARWKGDSEQVDDITILGVRI